METKENITLPVVSYAGKKLSDKVLPGDIFNTDINEYLVQKAVKVDLANRRVDTACTKTRDVVHGSNKKPWRQKGTGRARSGTANSPVWRHGGVVHGPNGEQNHELKMNKREHFQALTSVLTDKVKSGNLIVLTSKKFTSNKTKDFKKALKAIKGDEKKNLLVISCPCCDCDDKCEIDTNLILASRNLPNVRLVTSDNVSVYDVLNANKVIYVENAIPELLDEGKEE